MTKFWLTLVVLLLVHTLVCFGADRLFVTRYAAPPGVAPVETTSPEQLASGERVFVSVAGRIERPAALFLYAIAGYICLLAAVAWGVFTLVRNQAA